MSFNWRLLLAPESVLDYVVWHEACHLRVMDHSPNFWVLGAPILSGLRRRSALASGEGEYPGALVPIRARALVLGGVAAVVLIALVVALSGGSGYTVHARFVSASQLVKGGEVKVAGESVGKVTDVALTDDGQADVTLRDRRRRLPPAARGHARDHPRRVALGRQQPLRRPAARRRGRRRHPRGRAPGHRPHRGRGRPRPDLQHVRSRDAPGRHEVRPLPARLRGRPGGGGERRAALPQPRAVVVEPPVRRGQPQPAGLPALRRRDGEARHRRLRARRRAGGPGEQPRVHDLRPDLQRRGARRVDRPAAERAAQGRHDVRGPARRAGRPDAARRRRQARRAHEAAPTARRAAPLRPRRAAGRARPVGDGPLQGRRQRPRRAAAPPARRRRDRQQERRAQRGGARGRAAGGRQGAEGPRAAVRLPAALRARARGLVRRLLHDGRLRRARQLLARGPRAQRLHARPDPRRAGRARGAARGAAGGRHEDRPQQPLPRLAGAAPRRTSPTRTSRRPTSTATAARCRSAHEPARSPIPAGSSSSHC